MKRPFHQLDVFTGTALLGNPLAVIHNAQGLSDAQMAAYARWANLSECSFLLPPTDPAADYRVRIFTPDRELPFAGHPTLGSAHAWLALGGQPKTLGRVVQECGVGLVGLRQHGGRLWFAAPPLRRSGELEEAVLVPMLHALGLKRSAVMGSQWVVNGPQWRVLRLGSRAEVLALRPDFAAMGDMEMGVVAPADRGSEGIDFELRAFVPTLGVAEDPVTGSLNAGVAQWLIGAGLAPRSYIAGQGTAMGRAGRVHIEAEGDTVWVGGDVVTCIQGEVAI